MVRSLWTGATGMMAQQMNVDNIANNLANVNTTGYKTEVVEFKSLLYQDIQTRTTTANGEHKPIGAEVGLGVRNSSVMSVFTQGSLLATELGTDFAIDGKGFFGIKNENGETVYTRNGHFLFAEGTEGLTLCTTDGNNVLDSEGNSIVLEDGMSASKINFDQYGTLFYPDETGDYKSLGITIGLWQFPNPSGLSKGPNSTYEITPASGEALNEVGNASLTRSTLKNGYLEGSNVQVADEMVNLIVAQRAYEMNSKVITTTDEMMQQANQLKR